MYLGTDLHLVNIRLMKQILFISRTEELIYHRSMTGKYKHPPPPKVAIRTCPQTRNCHFLYNCLNYTLSIKRCGVYLEKNDSSGAMVPNPYIISTTSKPAVPVARGKTDAVSLHRLSVSSTCSPYHRVVRRRKSV
jgi:hypothetical protein